MTEFVTQSRDWIASLGAQLSCFVEPASGMRHLHLHEGGDQRVFMIAVPTRPGRSDGRAHVLEHVVLCGSERFPVADPFFAMMRRSLAGFMNAMTGPDCTLYLFATRDAADFDNLLEVYLDAVFFPRLERLSFLQEGWRLVLDGERLDVQGVVLNEMKGVEGDPTTPLLRAIRAQLLEGTTYAHDHGGESRAIPKLTHEALCAFHATHYHPSQAWLMTAGPVDTAQVQARLSERVLARLAPSARTSQAAPAVGTAPSGLAAPWSAPRRQRVEVPALPADGDEPGAPATGEHGLYLSWCVADGQGTTARARAVLLQAALLGADSAPLVRAMETAGYGRPGRLSGLDDSARQWLLHVGMEGLHEHEVEAAEARLRAALQQVAERGLPKAELDTAIEELRFERRDAASDDMPEAMARLLNAAPLVMRGADPLSALDGEAGLDALAAELKRPGTFKRMVADLLANPTCLVTHQVPAPDYFQRMRRREAAWLGSQRRRLDAAAKRRIKADARALHERQARADDPRILPRIRPDRIATDPVPLPTLQPDVAGVWLAALPDSRLCHAELIHDAGGLDESQWPWLALYAGVLTACGAGRRRSADAAAWRRRQVPRLWAEVAGITLADHSLRPALHLGASTLAERAAGIPEVLRAWSQAPRFDEPGRLGFAVHSWLEQRLAGLANESQAHARHAAAAPLSAAGQFRDRVNGVGALQFCSTLRAMLETPAGLAAIAERLMQVHAQLIARPLQALCGGAESALPGLADALAQTVPLLPPAPVPPGGGWTLPSARQPARLALPSGTPVNHCAAAWAAPAATPDDGATLAVAAALMSDQSLHRDVRERGGAYGAMARWSVDEQVFVMQSYRDPRLAGTFADFQAAIDSLARQAPTPDQLEQAVVTVIRQTDTLRSPQARLREAWVLRHRGEDTAARRRWRAQVLQCRPAQVRDAVQQWLHGRTPSRAAAVAPGATDIAGLEPIDL